MKDKLLGYAQQAVITEPYPDDRFPPSIYYNFLGILAAETKPRLAVELGVCGGGASFAMARNHPGGRVVGIDLDYQSYTDNIRFIIEHYQNFIFLYDDSVEAADYVGKIYGPVDLLFIDTVHSYDRTIMEWNAWQPHLSDRAIVCLDDLLRPGMPRAFSELSGEKLRLDFLHQSEHTYGGFGCVWGF